MELSSLAQLERSHRRHDDVMAELLEAARRFAAGRPDDGDLGLVHDAIAYFGRSVARHFVDEEGSVFPRLSTRRPELATALAELSAEHPAQIAMHAEVAAAARDLDGDARPAAGKALLDAAIRLAEAHRAHVGREDEIFAAAHEALTAEDDAEIVAEMEMRRGREDEAGGDGPGGGNGHGGGGGGGHGRGAGGGRGGLGRGGGGGGGGLGRGGGGGRGRASRDGSAADSAAGRGSGQRAARPASKLGASARRASTGAARTARRSGKAADKPARPASRAKTAKRATGKPAKRPASRRGKR